MYRFHFAGRYAFPFVRLFEYILHFFSGWWTFRFFQLHKTPSDLSLCHPTSECLKNETLYSIVYLISTRRYELLRFGEYGTYLLYIAGVMPKTT